MWSSGPRGYGSTNRTHPIRRSRPSPRFAPHASVLAPRPASVSLWRAQHERTSTRQPPPSVRSSRLDLRRVGPRPRGDSPRRGGEDPHAWRTRSYLYKAHRAIGLCELLRGGGQVAPQSHGGDHGRSRATAAQRARAHRQRGRDASSERKSASSERKMAVKREESLFVARWRGRPRCGAAHDVWRRRCHRCGRKDTGKARGARACHP